MQIFKTLSAFVLVAIIVTPASMNAQYKKKKKGRDEDQTDHQWDYTINRNNPSHIAPYNLFLSPFVMEALGMPGSGLGAYASIKYQAMDNIEAMGSFTYNYLIIAKGPGSYSYTPSALDPNLGFELGGTWFFSDETRHTKENVLLHTESTGYNSYTTYIARIPLDHEQRFGLRLSFLYMTYAASNSDGFYNIYNEADPSQTKIADNEGDLVTNAHTGIIAVGLASEKVHDYYLTFNNHSERDISRRMSWHLDLLLNTFTSLDDVRYQDSTFNVNKYTSKSPIGVRLGFESENLTSYGANFGFDIGAFPGPQTPLLLLNFKFGWGFGLGLKQS